MTKALVAEAVDNPDTPAFRERIVNEAAGRRRLPEAAEGYGELCRKAPSGVVPRSDA